MKYQIEVTETLKRIIEVDADDVCGAVAIVCRDYAEGAISLGADDVKAFNIQEYKAEDE
jgi:hypothetical protein